MNRRPNYQDITWFLDLNKYSQLDLDPPYQRRSVWTSKDRKFFLDTIFRGYPAPAIFIHKEIDDSGKTTYHVVDGKQRLETILLFVNNKIRIGHDFGDTSLNGKRWKDLDNLPDQKRLFWNYVLPVEYIDLVEGTLVEEVFERLNRNSRKLERQELRHAKYDGWFITLAEEEAKKDEWFEWGVSTRARARRMRDVQFISELLFVILEEQHFGFDQDSIDALYAKYEIPSEEEFNFVEDDVLNRLLEVKKIIKNLRESNESIITHFKTFNNFYTLWSIIALNLTSMPEIAELGKGYSCFMEQVSELAESPDEDLPLLIDKKEYKLPYQYLLNSKGASTDLAQREARYEVLFTALISS